MPADAVVPLAPGLWRDGSPHAEATVRPLTGADEALLCDLDAGQTMAERVTTLLATVVRRIGSIQPVTPADVRALAVGDRERLLLAVQRLTHGRRLDAVATCSAAACGALLDVTLDVDELVVAAPTADAAPAHELDVHHAGRRLRVRFRLPDGGDQETVARVAAVDPRAAGLVILRRAVLEARDDAGAAVAIDDALLAACAPALSAAILRLDPQSETSLAATCPECGAQSVVVLDVARFLLGTLAGWDALMVDVDRIARRYHWAEADILALPVARRRRYLALCDEPAMAGA